MSHMVDTPLTLLSPRSKLSPQSLCQALTCNFLLCLFMLFKQQSALQLVNPDFVCLFLTSILIVRWLSKCRTSFVDSGHQNRPFTVDHI